MLTDRIDSGMIHTSGGAVLLDPQVRYSTMTAKTNPVPSVRAGAKPTIDALVKAWKTNLESADDVLGSLRVHYIVPLVKADGTVDRKGADFIEVRRQAEAALVAHFMSKPRTVGGVRVVPGSELHKRIPDLFALSKGVMKKMTKTDADWIVATGVKNDVRCDWNRLVARCLPKVAKTDDADGADDAPETAPGSGTKASDKATAPTALTPEAVLAAIQNCAASMPDASALATFINQVSMLAKSLDADRKAGRKIHECEV